MKKSELSKLLHSLGIAVNEGITSEGNKGKYPRIVYWPYIESEKVASDETYTTVFTYQISMFSKTPRHEKFIELKKKLREAGYRPEFYHEYVENDPVFSKTWHTYFSLEIEDDTEVEE